MTPSFKLTVIILPSPECMKFVLTAGPSEEFGFDFCYPIEIKVWDFDFDPNWSVSIISDEPRYVLTPICNLSDLDVFLFASVFLPKGTIITLVVMTALQISSVSCILHRAEKLLVVNSGSTGF